MQIFHIFYIGSFPVYKGAKNLGKSTQKVDKGDIVEGSLEVKLPTGPFNNLSWLRKPFAKYSMISGKVQAQMVPLPRNQCRHSQETIPAFLVKLLLVTTALHVFASGPFTISQT